MSWRSAGGRTSSRLATFAQAMSWTKRPAATTRCIAAATPGGVYSSTSGAHQGHPAAVRVRVLAREVRRDLRGSARAFSRVTRRRAGPGRRAVDVASRPPDPEPQRRPDLRVLGEVPTAPASRPRSSRAAVEAQRAADDRRVLPQRRCQSEWLISATALPGRSSLRRTAPRRRRHSERRQKGRRDARAGTRSG